MAGWKEWQIGEVVEAADFQSYVQDQVVQVYADSAARGSALGTAVTEGMVAYLADTNSTEVYDGSSWIAVGAGDITSVTAGTGLTGGGTSGSVTLNVNQAALYTDGTAGYTVLSNGTAGLIYQALSPNYIINGAFDFWQRGTSFTPTADAFSYTADRWDTARATGTSGATVTRQSSGLTGFEYALRYQRNSGDTSTASLYSIYRLESSQSIPLAGQTVTFSFYARAGANYSASSSALLLSTYSGTGTSQGGYPSTWTGSTTLSSPTFTLTTSWQRFTTTYTIGSSATQLGFLFTFNPTGTASTNDWFEITGVQLEAGSVATPFRRAANTLQGELAACQRYFQVLTFQGTRYTTTDAYCYTDLFVQMRATPTLVTPSSLTNVVNTLGVGAQTATAFASQDTTPQKAGALFTGIPSGTIGVPVATTVDIRIQAEL